MMKCDEGFWWQTPYFLLALVLAFMIPLLWPSIPPLTDLPNHMGRFRIQLGIDESPYLAQWFSFEWKPVANLGFDLLIVPMAKMFGLELGMKLIVLAVPPLTVAGMLWLAREVHGDIPPTALFALPLAYSFPFQFGFLNFTLGMAFAFPAVALWLRMGRSGFGKLRAALFMPISAVLLIIHSESWGMFGLIIYALEWQLARQAGQGVAAAAARALLTCLPLSPPILVMLFWFSGSPPGPSFGYFQWQMKVFAAGSILRNYYLLIDVVSALVLYGLLYAGLRRDGMRFHPLLAAGALPLFAVFLLMPAAVMGSGFNDLRMMPYVVAIGVLALRPVAPKPETLRLIALAGLLFIGIRLGIHTWTFLKIDRAYQEQLAAIDHIPRGARVFALSNNPCFSRWDATRMDHLAEMAIVRRDAFVNGQWISIPMLKIHRPDAAGFTTSPSDQLRSKECPERAGYTLDFVLRRLPRAAFDYLWLVNLPSPRWPSDPGLTPVWHGPGNGILYRISKPGQARQSEEFAPELSTPR